VKPAAFEKPNSAEDRGRRSREPGDPVGVFDSGVGGLSVLRHIRVALPKEDLLYVADSAEVPYGPKGVAFVKARAFEITAFLLERGAKAIVVACNAATAAAIGALRERHRIPVIGVEPALKPAATSSSGVVAVLSTALTPGSEKFGALLGTWGRSVEVIVTPCPGWVEMVERGEASGPAALELVRAQLAPLLARGVDTFVLGCTHYPFLTPLIREVAGREVAILETGEAVARQLRRRLAEEGLLKEGARPGRERFFTSGEPEAVASVVRKLWGPEASVEHFERGRPVRA
jgi:glutamate racemase